MKISIFGLGYVGAVSCACFAEMGHDVVGVDVSPAKLDLINQGKSPIVEERLDELIQKAVANNKLVATADIQQAVNDSELSIICVGTPSKPSGDLDLSYVEKVSEEIGEAIKQKDDYHLVVVRSTVLPGTCKNLVIPSIERTSGKRHGVDFGVSMNPEFLRESTAVHDFYYPPMLVIGEYDKRAGDLVEDLYRGIECPVFRRETEIAEMIKYTCNVWHAIKVSFANEIGAIAKSVGVDGRDVMDIVCEDKKLNISTYYMKPGYAYGGSCLPKDVRALTAKSIQQDLNTPLISSLSDSNAQHMQRGFELVYNKGKKKVSLLGLSFKAGTDDLRESPLVELVERLLGKGLDIAIYDENVQYARIHGSNKDYINNHIPHISELLNSNIKEVIEHGDVLIIGNGSEEFVEIANNPPAGKQVVDLQGLMESVTTATAEGICW
jgi:GDP-mannose 6-dehydrogenase